jgi:protein-tyrosine-phosphatase/predicted ATP-grasp superfamily ATP-dependent carboligase
VADLSSDRVLVLDGNSRAAVEAVQSLGKRGLEVHVAAPSDCPAFRSRWAARTLVQPATSNSSRFIEWLRVLPNEYPLIIPSTGYSLYHLAGLPDPDPLRERAVLPGAEALNIALDKARTIETAVRLGISVPASSLVKAPSDGPNGRLPRVLKPTRSVIARGEDLDEVFPELVHDAAQRKDALARLLARGPVLEQELVPGIGIGVECLYAGGTLIWHFAHERLHEGTGGGIGSGSFYRKSITPPRALLDAARALLDDLRWHGVGMVEFKYDAATRRFWLMEINPRLWGSVALAIDAGVDFPYGLYCLATDADPGPQPSYRRPYYTRLVPLDLEWIGRQIRRRGFSRSVELLSLVRLLTGRESWDHFAWTDPGPLLRSTAIFIGVKRAALKSRRIQRADAQAALRQHAANVPRLGARRASARVLFVCTGNICRSPLAARLWEAQYTALPAASAGFITQTGRRSPHNIQAVAAARGLSLSEHRSRTLDEAMLRDSDVIVLFEPRHFVELRATFPRYLDRVVMLGAFLDPPQAIIRDPYQRSVAEGEQFAAQVEAALPGLARLLGLPARPAIDAPLPAPKLAIMPSPDLPRGDGERDGQTDRGAGAVRRSDTLGRDS